MNPKYKECTEILNELKDMVQIVIETGAGDDMSPMEIIEETLYALKILDSEKQINFIEKTPTKKKGLLH